MTWSLALALMFAFNSGSSFMEVLDDLIYHGKLTPGGKRAAFTGPVSIVAAVWFAVQASP